MSPTHGEQENSVWNGHYACTCYHPLFVFNQFGDLERSALRPGNVHSADGWNGVLKPVVVRNQGKVLRIYFRADAAFTMPEVYEYLEAGRIKYAIRLPANRVLQDRISYLLKRPVGRPPNEVRRFYANFTHQAGSWTKPRRVIAKVEWHPGELYPRVGFIVTNLSRPAERVSGVQAGGVPLLCGIFRPRVQGGCAALSDRIRPDGSLWRGALLGWEELDPAQRFPVKSTWLRADEILGSQQRAAAFAGGPVILARLSPMDYHHLHYPDDGATLETDWRGRRLWTVNWHALQHQPDILFRNERQIHILQTDHFGRLGFVEVGALSVGRIVQLHPVNQRYARGAEKSVFKFGGSAVVLFGERDAWRPSSDILKYTKQNIETLVRLGHTIAERSVRKSTQSLKNYAAAAC